MERRDIRTHEGPPEPAPEGRVQESEGCGPGRGAGRREPPCEEAVKNGEKSGPEKDAGRVEDGDGGNGEDAGEESDREEERMEKEAGAGLRREGNSEQEMAVASLGDPGEIRVRVARVERVHPEEGFPGRREPRAPCVDDERGERNEDRDRERVSWGPHGSTIIDGLHECPPRQPTIALSKSPHRDLPSLGGGSPR